MDISIARMSQGAVHTGLRRAPAAQETGRESVFGKYLDVENRKRQELAAGERGLPSAYLQFKEDYYAWKARQPETALPDSQGWTEENLDFLRERYSGSLSANEVYDALETMKAMGVISQKEENYATGNVLIAISMDDMGVVREAPSANSESFWLGSFGRTPMVGFQSLDDIFSWLEEFRKGDWPDAIPYAEARARGWA